MAKIVSISDLAQCLDIRKGELFRIAESIDENFDLLEITDPSGKRKVRQVVHARVRLGEIQKRLLRRVLCKYLLPSDHSHGGIPGRSIKTNASQHLNSRFVYTADISNFFPSVHFGRVRAIYERMGMSNDTAGICTKLSTYGAHLALGIATSPFLADQILKPFDAKLAAVCAGLELVYTRFVDDISISGRFSFDQSGIPKLVSRFLRMHGFSKNDKESMGVLSEGATITKLRVRGGRLDVSRDYIGQLMEQMVAHQKLAEGESFDDGFFQTENQMWGKIQFVSWINPRRRKHLVAYYRKIEWPAVYENATRLGILRHPKMQVRSITAQTNRSSET